MKQKTINVNRLNRILEKHFKFKEVIIDKIYAGQQHSPKDLDIGFGGILTLTFSHSPKKGARR